MTTRREFLTTLAAGMTAAAILPAEAALAAAPRFGVDGDHFVLDGQPFQFLAGEMHYPRIPRELWRDRLRKMKALGLNALSTYVFWNAHEVRQGQYDFSGNLDLAAWVKTAQEEGLLVLLRPGPYACAEWDGGGLPSWLLDDPDIKPRSRDPRYLTPAGEWLMRVGQEVAHLEIDKGGPIVMVQVENEYGSFGKDLSYVRAVRDQIRAAGFAGTLYTVDGAAVIDNGGLPELVNGINFGTTDKAEKEFARYAQFKATGPRMCTELWGGWFDHFGELHANMPIPPLMESLKWMLDNHISISFYMVHGGTSFGFAAGANFDRDSQTYQPDISSYDYDAMLDEAGRPTPKFEAAKALFQNYLPASRFAPMPAPEKALTIAPFRLHETASLSQLLGAPVTADAPRTLEQLKQPHGMVLYRHKFGAPAHGTLSFDEVRDYALVSVAGKPAATLDRRLHERQFTVSARAGATVDILVDAMGHINYGDKIGKDQKGLIGAATLDGKPVHGWQHYGLPLDDLSALRFAPGVVSGPAFYRGHFQVDEQGFTFLDVRGWGKGYVWVNGHNLGRYWSAGPQRALFVPTPFLETGINEVIVLDLHPGEDRVLSGGADQIWDRPGLVTEQ